MTGSPRQPSRQALDLHMHRHGHSDSGGKWNIRDQITTRQEFMSRRRRAVARGLRAGTRSLRRRTPSTRVVVQSTMVQFDRKLESNDLGGGRNSSGDECRQDVSMVPADANVFLGSP